MLRFTLPAAALAASALLFSFSASADDHGRGSRDSGRHHYSDRHDNDRGRYNDRDHDRGRYDNRRDYRWSRPAPRQRYYWNDGRYWRYGFVPDYYRGSYYTYQPRDSRGRLIITVPLW